MSLRQGLSAGMSHVKSPRQELRVMQKQLKEGQQALERRVHEPHGEFRAGAW